MDNSLFLANLCNLNDKKIVLASQSPRRASLLRSIGLEFEVISPGISEEIKDNDNPIESARHIAIEKAQWTKKNIAADLIISADTLVIKDNKIFLKPKDIDEASSMLRALSNSTHDVITAVCLLSEKQQIVIHEITEVTFYELSDIELKDYINSGEPMDKAGAYGIQGFASIFIRKIEGCYFNVMGFPIAKFYQSLKEMKI
jgi:septum formation protein